MERLSGNKVRLTGLEQLANDAHKDLCEYDRIPTTRATELVRSTYGDRLSDEFYLWLSDESRGPVVVV